ncbi:MAG: hypothetical protein CVU73_01195 [Deltaproteobacteria bacterium HGW-Deltaproteobacteria-8]|jgi:hypothetical protein|nr:MAG: hypothetical protein CVU73_01195 [Deltaproteobacteria bacterium HGW-Deltaproteobacteria-8]
MTLYFPHLHPDLLPDNERQALPEGVRFLDPGLANPNSPDYVLPENAPFDRRLAKAILADTMRFGESVANPRDIAVHGLLQQAQALAPESGRLVLAEVERSIANAKGKPEAPADPLLEARRQAQTLLLLAWNLEERMLDLRQIDLGLRDSWARLGESVHPADEGEHDAAEAGDEADGDAMAMGTMLSGLSLPDSYGEALPWRRILEAFAVLAPGQDLVTADAAIAQTLREAGVPETGGVFEAPAWRLSGLDRCPAARPWLDVPVRLACIASAVKGA